VSFVHVGKNIERGEGGGEGSGRKAIRGKRGLKVNVCLMGMTELN
jgi:hypothetical protein